MCGLQSPNSTGNAPKSSFSEIWISMSESMYLISIQWKYVDKKVNKKQILKFSVIFVVCGFCRNLHLRTKTFCANSNHWNMQRNQFVHTIAWHIYVYLYSYNGLTCTQHCRPGHCRWLCTYSSANDLWFQSRGAPPCVQCTHIAASRASKFAVTLDWRGVDARCRCNWYLWIFLNIFQIGSEWTSQSWSSLHWCPVFKPCVSSM